MTCLACYSIVMPTRRHSAGTSGGVGGRFKEGTRADQTAVSGRLSLSEQPSPEEPQRSKEGIREEYDRLRSNADQLVAANRQTRRFSNKSGKLNRAEGRVGRLDYPRDRRQWPGLYQKAAKLRIKEGFAIPEDYIVGQASPETVDSLAGVDFLFGLKNGNVRGFLAGIDKRSSDEPS